MECGRMSIHSLPKAFIPSRPPNLSVFIGYNMISTILVAAVVTILILKWVAYLRALPPGPILPLPVLRRMWWSKFYGKNDVDIILGLEKEYGGTFSVNTGSRRAVIMSDIDKVQVRICIILGNGL